MQLRIVVTWLLAVGSLSWITVPVTASDPTPEEIAKDERLQRSVDELRLAIGKWNVVTEFMDESGNVANSVDGTYEFSWVAENRVAMGRSDLPSMKQSAGILFYVNEKKEKIEMVAVHPDGMLWIMTGPLGGSTRYSQEFDTADGGKSQLRFTRYNVQPDSFESKMEYTTDGGKTWTQGNRQIFRRAAK